MTRLENLLALRLAAALCLIASGCAQSQEAAPALVLERTIVLPDVRGRIDHLAIDPAHRRLIVAELGNNSVDVIDVEGGVVVHRITGLSAPQGLAFDQSGQLIVIADRGDGAVRLFDAANYQPVATIALGEDADNVRIDPRNGHAVVGYGDGALCVIDLTTHEVLSRIALPAHPEGFQIEPQTGRTFVNLPDRRLIAAVDLDAGIVTTWNTPALLFNYPLALDPAGPRYASVFRLPARLAMFDANAGTVIASQSTCGDSDDLFFDSLRHRLYVACGAGALDVFSVGDGQLQRHSRVRTQPGSRTALFVPDLDRLFVGARARRGQSNASILVFRPAEQ